jgi:hypothetical protein
LSGFPVEDVVADSVSYSAISALKSLTVKVGDAFLLSYSMRISSRHAFVDVSDVVGWISVGMRVRHRNFFEEGRLAARE